MIPNDFGIIRQADHNLFALMFPPLTDISEYEIEVIQPEYIDGYYMNTAGAPQVSSRHCYASIDVTRYDYVIIPCFNNLATGISSGLSSAPSGQSLVINGFVTARPLANDIIASSWILLKTTPSANYAIVNSVVDYHIPVIGFKRHRSDGANPLGVIQPLDPGALEPNDPVPDPEDQEER